VHKNENKVFFLLFSFCFGAVAFCRRAAAGARREESNCPAVLLRGHESGRPRVGHVVDRFGGRLRGIRLSEKK